MANLSRQWRKIDKLLGLPITAKKRVMKDGKPAVITVVLRPGKAPDCRISTKGSFRQKGLSATGKGEPATKAQSRPHGATRKQTKDEMKAIHTLNERRLNAELAKLGIKP